MQLPRVIIAAVFFIIGALIAIPALTKSGGSKSAASTASTSPSVSISGSSPSASPSASPSSKKSSPKATTSHRSSPQPGFSTSGTPKPTATLPKLAVTVSPVGCPSREVRITVANSGKAAADFTIEQNGSVVLADRVGASGSRTNPITLTEGQATKIAVLSGTQTVRSVTRTAHCSTTAAAPTKKANTLPHTGTDSAAMYAKIATGVAAMITGVIVFWWGGMWPRRRESMYGDAASKELREPKERIGR